jgi:hypothetical protein
MRVKIEGDSIRKIEGCTASLPLRLIFVDYLQLIDGTGGGKRNQERREREIAFASAKLKELAKELRIPVSAPRSAQRRLATGEAPAAQRRPPGVQGRRARRGQGDLDPQPGGE